MPECYELFNKINPETRPVKYSDNENMFNIMEVVNLWDNLESLKI